MSSEGIIAERPARRGSGGRPTREEALRRDARLLDVATTLFMERGFDGTSIDAVAEAAGVGKPTVYARYRDKRDLFAAVLRGRIRDWLAPLSAAAEAQATDTISPTDSPDATIYDFRSEMSAADGWCLTAGRGSCLIRSSFGTSGPR